MGNNIYQIKRSLNTASPVSLANGEQAYTANGDVLYIGSNGVVVPIGGKRTPGTLTANQALVANATGYLDVLKTANLYIGSATINAINAVSNSTVLGAAANNELTTTWAVKNYVDLKTSGSLISGNGMTTNATNFGVLAGNSQIVSNSSGIWLAQSNIDHDLLGNFVGNEHIDHTAVSITAGNGLTGGGTIAASRSLAVTAGIGIASNSTGVHVVAGNSQIVSNTTGIWINQSQIAHDSLSGYSSNKHIDHTGVSITAGNGLTGGGTIDASRTLTVATVSGLTVNSTGVHVLANSGITANSFGTFVKAGTGVTVNATGVHIGQAVETTSSPTFQDLTVSGNLVINGTLATIAATNISVSDPIIKLANGNSTTDSIDIGFYGNYGNSTVSKWTGMFRDASDGKFRLFAESQTEPTTTVNLGATGYVPATLVANLESASATITGGSISGITDLAVADGGTGLSSFTLNGIFYGSGTSTLGFLTGTDGQVLQSVSGGPQFATLDGGTF